MEMDRINRLDSRSGIPIHLDFRHEQQIENAEFVVLLHVV